MKIGTHNSMSYLPPKKWYMYPFRFIAKCQRVNLEEQYKLGARMFDLRISYDDITPEFRHGSMVYKGNVEEILAYLNSLGKSIYVRLILEIKKNTKDRASQEGLFFLNCSKWEKEFTHLKFFGGQRKYDWKQIYKFKLDDIEVIQKISSMTGTILDDWWPWLYARFNNKKNIENRKKSKWLLVDFIDIQ